MQLCNSFQLELAANVFLRIGLSKEEKLQNVRTKATS